MSKQRFQSTGWGALDQRVQSFNLIDYRPGGTEPALFTEGEFIGLPRRFGEADRLIVAHKG